MYWVVRRTPEAWYTMGCFITPEAAQVAVNRYRKAEPKARFDVVQMLYS